MGWFLFNISASRQKTNNKAAIKREGIFLFSCVINPEYTAYAEMAQESHPQCYLLLLNLLTKNDLRLFSWNQDNTHTHPHTSSDRHSFLPPAPIPVGPWQSPSPWQYVIPDPISISSTWETTGSMWRGSHEGGICCDMANRASRAWGRRQGERDDAWMETAARSSQPGWHFQPNHLFWLANVCKW